MWIQSTTVNVADSPYKVNGVKKYKCTHQKETESELYINGM